MNTLGVMAIDWSFLDVKVQGSLKYEQPLSDLVKKIQSKPYNQNDIREIKSFLFSPLSDFHGWGERASKTFKKWRAKGDMKLPIMLEAIVDFFDISQDHRLLRPAMVACVLGEMPNLTIFHSNHHFREVTATAMRLASVHNEMHDDEKKRLTIDNVLMLFIAACIHDFAHDGQGNMVNGMHTPSRVEMRSLNRAKPYLFDAGMTHKDWADLDVMVVCTDVSGDVNKQAKSPASIARDIFLAHKYGNIIYMQVEPFYERLVSDRRLSLITTLLDEADLAMSMGLDYKFSKEMTKLIAAETKAFPPSAQTLYGFLNYICHGGPVSGAGMFLLGQSFQSILLDAEDDSQKGVLYS